MSSARETAAVGCPDTGNKNPMVIVANSVYTGCIAHALTTEREEIMGLLLGFVDDDSGLVSIMASMTVRRNDKRPDRCEVAPEQLVEVTVAAEELSAVVGREVMVIGWYHSHPHITALPSHVDLRTQANYQALHPSFVGLIFTAFNKAKAHWIYQLIGFRAVAGGSCGKELVKGAVAVRIAPLSQIMTVEEIRRLDDSDSVFKGSLGHQAISRATSELLAEIRERHEPATSRCSQDDSSDMSLVDLASDSKCTQQLCAILADVLVPQGEFLEDMLTNDRIGLEVKKRDKNKFLAQNEEIKKTVLNTELEVRRVKQRLGEERADRIERQAASEKAAAEPEHEPAPVSNAIVKRGSENSITEASNGGTTHVPRARARLPRAEDKLVPSDVPAFVKHGSENPITEPGNVGTTHVPRARARLPRAEDKLVPSDIPASSSNAAPVAAPSARTSTGSTRRAPNPNGVRTGSGAEATPDCSSDRAFAEKLQRQFDNIDRRRSLQLGIGEEVEAVDESDDCGNAWKAAVIVEHWWVDTANPDREFPYYVKFESGHHCPISSESNVRRKIKDTPGSSSRQETFLKKYPRRHEILDVPDPPEEAPVSVNIQWDCKKCKFLVKNKENSIRQCGKFKTVHAERCKLHAGKPLDADLVRQWGEQHAEETSSSKDASVALKLPQSKRFDQSVASQLQAVTYACPASSPTGGDRGQNETGAGLASQAEFLAEAEPKRRKTQSSTTPPPTDALVAPDSGPLVGFVNVSEEETDLDNE